MVFKHMTQHILTDSS